MDRAPAPRSGPLAGIRVADFCWMGVGAIATRLLADFGADVIKIEDRTRIDLPRRLPIYKGENALGSAEERRDADPNMGGLFNNYSRNKLGITINMRTPEGRTLAERLITVSDIVTENFAPGVMERWGLTYERLRGLNPSIIYARMSGYGHSGPHAEYRSYGPVVQAVSGLSHISGLPGREPSGWGLSYMDNLAAYYNSAAVLMAVLHREQTGEGTEIDVSAFEAGISLLGPVILDVAVNNRSTRRPDFPTGNRLEHHDAAPHGVYPCAGNDRWAAIAVFDQDEWVSLVTALGRPAWTTDPRFATQRDRTANHDALDEHITAWTRQRTPYDVMNLLQEHGVRAAAVQTAEDLNDHDPQIESRRLFFEMDHPVIGMARFEGIPMHMSRVEPDNWRSAPLLGEDNDHVFGRVLGLSEDERAELRSRGVI